MNFDINAYAISTASILTAGSVTWLVGKLLSWMIKNRNRLTGTAAKLTARTLPASINIALYIGGFSFFIAQLRFLIDQSGPPSRMDTMLIAFWTWWLVWLFTELVAGKPFVGGAR